MNLLRSLLSKFYKDKPRGIVAIGDLCEVTGLSRKEALDTLKSLEEKGIIKSEVSGDLVSYEFG